MTPTIELAPVVITASECVAYDSASLAWFICFLLWLSIVSKK